MTTITRATKDAQFFTNASNARRALKKLFACSTEVANTLLHTEAYEDGGRVWFSPAAVTAAANAVANATVEADKATIVAVTTVQPVAKPTAPSAPVAAKVSKSRSVVQNGVRKPIKGVCADVWATLDEMQAACPDAAIHIADVKGLAAAKGWNINNVTIEFYGWRKFHGINKAK